MDDLATRRRLHGPVHTLRTETAEWNAEAAEWKLHQHFTVTTFRPDGRTNTTDTHNHDGSIAHTRFLYDESGRLTERHTWMNGEPIQKALYLYDEAGRHIRTTYPQPDGSSVDSETCTYDAEGRITRVVTLPGGPPPRDRKPGRFAYSIEGTNFHLTADGAGRMSTSYDKQKLPSKVILQDKNNSPLQEIRFERDEHGRPLTIEVITGDSPIRKMVEQHPPEQRAALAAVLGQIFGSSWWRMTYAYDARGRLLRETRTMGTLGEEHTTYRYDELHDEAIEQSTENRSRTASMNDDGAITYSEDKTDSHQNRFAYQYDQHGNWTERIVSWQPEPGAPFQPSNMERRIITYYS